MKMRRILGSIAIAITAAASFTCCNNRQPFAKLTAAVDSANVAMSRHPIGWCDSCHMTYDQTSNTVNYTIFLPGEIDSLLMDEGKDLMEGSFLAALAQNAEYNLTGEIVDANADVTIEFKGAQGGEYTIPIAGQKVADAFYAANPDLKK